MSTRINMSFPELLYKKNNPIKIVLDEISADSYLLKIFGHLLCLK